MSNPELVVKPRYARVNTFKKSVANVITELRDQGYIFLPSLQETYAEYLEDLVVLPHNHFMVDFHIKELLVFYSEFPFIRNELYKNGTLILQDKASCLAPLLLEPPQGSVVLDMCAAPGMKTNYLANLVGKNGRVYAVERNQERYLTLTKLMEHHGIKNVTCMHGDATKITGDELADVEYILVDPTCSGSGMVGRTDFLKSEPDRLKNISSFQIGILCQALKRFPNVNRVTYSTCSIYPEENEYVVQTVLASCQHFRLVNLQEKMSPNWNHFGSDKFGDIGPSCLYANSEKDFTNGFFVAVFERIKVNKKRKHKQTEENEDEVKNEQEETESKKKRKKKQKKISDAIEEMDNLYEKNGEIKVEETIEGTTEQNEDDVKNEQEETESKKKRKKKQKKISDAVEELDNLYEKNGEIKVEETIEGTTEQNEDDVKNEQEETESKKKRKKKQKKISDAVEELDNLYEKNGEIKVEETIEGTTEQNEDDVKNEQEETESKNKRKKKQKKISDAVEESGNLYEKNEEVKVEKNIEGAIDESIAEVAVEEIQKKKSKKKRKAEEFADQVL